jgi:signal transduction histidine kinase
MSGDGRGLGITTMRERASLLDGHCVIQSARGQGTQIDVHVPCVLQPTLEAGEVKETSL